MTRLCGALTLAYVFAAAAEPLPIPREALRSGIEFASPDVRAMQADDVQNPAMLWVERGKALWEAPPQAAERACAGCHGDVAASMKGVAARYPVWDPKAARVVDLEDRINACRTQLQRAAPLPREAEDLNALTAYVASASREMPVAVSVDAASRAALERGRAFYFQRRGQMNLSCAHCHDQNVGKRLLSETISQGHGNAFPAYRLEWQTVGSLQRRLRACLYGVRAEMPAEGSQTLAELELFLAWRANGLPLEAPGVRR